MGLSHSQNFIIICHNVHVHFYKQIFIFDQTNQRYAELMIAKQAQLLSQERSKLPSVQSMTDKMSRLTNRKPHNPKLLLNELTSGDRNVTFSGSHNNHSTAKPTSSEGKGMGGQESQLTPWNGRNTKNSLRN